MQQGIKQGMKQQCFTLIELVMVFVILGVLAAVAIPKSVDMKADAAAAATQGVAGTLSSAAAVNYAARSANAAKGVAIANCTDVASALQGGLPAGYTITGAAVAAGAPTACTLNNANVTPAVTGTFTAIGIL